MKKNRKIWIPVVSGVLALAVVIGLVVYFTGSGRTPTSVYPVRELSYPYWESGKTTGGIVTADKLQNVYLTATQQISKIYVQEGQKVSVGTPLMAYDTTLSQLELDRKKLDIDKTKLRLQAEQSRLAEIKRMRPVTVITPAPTVPPTTTAPQTVKPNRNMKEDELFLRLGDGKGTTGDPQIIWVREKHEFNQSFIEQILDGRKELYTILETRKGDSHTGEIVIRMGVHFAAVDEEVPVPQAENDTPEQPEVTEPTQPDEPIEPTEATEAQELPDTDPSEPEPTETTEPTVPTEPDPPKITITRYTFYLFSVEEAASKPVTPTRPTPTVDQGSGYTADAIAQMRAEKEAEIRELQFSIKMAEAEYKIMQKEFDNGVILSEVDGYVTSLLDAETAMQENLPILKVSGGGGFFIQCSVSELDRANLYRDQVVEVNDWMSGNVYSGVITEIGDSPVDSDMGYDSSDTYYPFTVTVDASATLQPDYYVDVTYGSTAGDPDTAFCLEAPFVRTENGKSYVLVQNVHGTLEKRYIETASMEWSDSVLVLSGLKPEDYVAFPYGKYAREGAATTAKSADELYSNPY